MESNIPKTHAKVESNIPRRQGKASDTLGGRGGVGENTLLVVFSDKNAISHYVKPLRYWALIWLSMNIKLSMKLDESFTILNVNTFIKATSPERTQISKLFYWHKRYFPQHIFFNWNAIRAPLINRNVKQLKKIRFATWTVLCTVSVAKLFHERSRICQNTSYIHITLSSSK